MYWKMQVSSLVRTYNCTEHDTKGYSPHFLMSGHHPCLPHHHHHYPSRQLAYRAATKLLHPCLSLASLWMLPQLWLIFFISASTVLHQTVFSRPPFHFPSGVQRIATLLMELASLHSMCQIQHHYCLVMMVSISSCWHPSTLYY